MARAFDTKTQEMYRKREDERCCALYVNDPRVFRADKILEIRAITTEIEYSIKWTGYGGRYNEWVAARNVTPDLKRAFSRDKKKKEIKMWKEAKAKARAMRNKYDTITLSSTIDLTSTIVVRQTRRRNTNRPMISTATEDSEGNGKLLSVTMLAESDPEIPDWTTPAEEEEDYEEIDTSMSVTSDESEVEVLARTSSINVEEEKGTLLSTMLSEQSQFEIPERTTLPEKKSDSGYGASTCAGLTLEGTVDTNRRESDQYSCESLTLVLESESEIDSFEKKNEPEEYLLGFNELLEPVFTYV